MNRKHLKQIFRFLNCHLVEYFERPCENCGYFECEKNILNEQEIIKKSYRWNDIEWRACKRETKERYLELMDVLRLPLN